MILEGLRSKILFGIARRKMAHVPMRQPCSLGKAQTIGILFDAQEQENRHAVLTFCKELKQKGKEVQLLGFVRKRDPESTYHFPYLTLHDVNWFFQPKGGTAGYFIKYPFDLLINLCTWKHLPFEYISAVSRAKFRIGAFGKGSMDHYDFLVAGVEKLDEQSMINNIQTYFGR